MGITTAELADKMSVDTTTITRWETGSRKPDVYTASKLAQILGCTIDFLILGVEENPTPTPPSRGREASKEAANSAGQKSVA